MTKRISIRSYRKPDNLCSPLDLVVCEGETEVDYLCEFARSLRVHAHICKRGGTDPKNIVNTVRFDYFLLRPHLHAFRKIPQGFLDRE